MESADLDVLSKAANWLSDGAEAVLATVVRTWGSSPRPPGAMMALRHDGAVAGSVSGGCIEDDLIARVRDAGLAALLGEDGKPSVQTYGVLAEDARRFGIPCGGTLRIVIERLQAQSRIPDLVDRLRHRQSTLRVLDSKTGDVELRPPSLGAELFFDEKTLAVTLGPSYRLIAIGAGQLSQYLCQTAVGLGFAVVVCDPREEYTSSWTAEGVEIVQSMPDDVVLAAGVDSRTAIIALTHDPKLDDLALMEALRSEAFYVGALGSRANHANRVERLRTHFGLADDELSRLRGPAGIHIGSRTPAEIALSILAEVVAVKNGVAMPAGWTVEAGKRRAELHQATVGPTAW